MKIFILTINLLTFVFSTFSQSQITEKFNYDKEAMLYYKLDQDETNVYISLYKDEYAVKIRMPGAIKVYFDLSNTKDTLNALQIKYPIVKETTNWERLEIKNFKSVPNGEYDIYNEFGIQANGVMDEMEKSGVYDKDRFIFEGKIVIPKTYLNVESGANISILIFLRGQRMVALPAGRESPMLNSSIYGSNAEQIRSYYLHIDTWSDTWIDFALN